MLLTPSAQLTAALNRQIGNEMGASMQYIAIANYFEVEALEELAGFFYRQADEEREHAMKFVRFLLDADARVEMPPIAGPQNAFSTAEEAVQKSLDWEQEVTRQIYDLIELAKTENHQAALRFLDWFVTEQVEEVATMNTLLAIVRRAGESGLLHVEEYLARKGGVIGVAAE